VTPRTDAVTSIAWRAQRAGADRPSASVSSDGPSIAAAVWRVTTSGRGLLRQRANPSVLGGFLPAVLAAYSGEAVDERTSAERREQLRERLLAYCKRDTEAMLDAGACATVVAGGVTKVCGGSAEQHDTSTAVRRPRIRASSTTLATRRFE